MSTRPLAQELKKAVATINERIQTGSKAEHVCKDAFGFCKQQEAGDQIRAEQRRRGAEIPTNELHSRWPCTAPGWSMSAERDAALNGEAPIGRVLKARAANGKRAASARQGLGAKKQKRSNDSDDDSDGEFL